MFPLFGDADDVVRILPLDCLHFYVIKGFQSASFADERFSLRKDGCCDDCRQTVLHDDALFIVDKRECLS